MGVLSRLNSSSAPLGAGGVFVGQFERCGDASAITVLVHSDAPAAVNGVTVQWSANGVDIHDEQSFSYVGSVSEQARVWHTTIRSDWYRVRYINSGSAQTQFQLQTLLRQDQPCPSISAAGLAVTTQHDAYTTNSVLVAPRVDEPGTLVFPRATGDPFLIVARPPNSTVVFRRAIPASLFSTQLDFFGFSGANRDYMSVSNNANSDLLVHLGFDPASATNFTERVKPGETFRLGLSWILYGGPVQGIWVPLTPTAGPIKFLPINATLPLNVVIPSALGKSVRVLNYVLSSKDAVRATFTGLTTPLSGPIALGALSSAGSATVMAASGTLDSPQFEALPNEPVNLVLTDAVPVTGHIAYVEVATPTLTGDAQVIELL